MSKRGRIIYWLLNLVLILLVSIGSAMAQLTKADQHYAAFHFQKAADLYARAFQSEEDARTAKKAGNAYRKMKDYGNAELYYKLSLNLDSSDVETRMFYGMMLKANDKVKEAKEVFAVYAVLHPKDIEMQNLVQSCDKVELWQKEAPRSIVSSLPSINTEGSELCPQVYGNGIVYVSDVRTDLVTDKHSGIDDHSYLSIRKLADLGNLDTEFSESFSKFINLEYHNGPISFDSAQTFAAFTRVDVAKKHKKAFINRPEIYFANKVNDKWQNIVPFEHDNLEFAFAHPTLSPDGRTMVFVSDMKGGMGGKDLYVSNRTGDSWSIPKNLGEQINSSNDEMFPYLSKKGDLYFSSDGHIGFGGLDIYRSYRTDKLFGDPENLRGPINSSHDDFGMCLVNDTSGYFTSNREGGAGADDIYKFELLPIVPSEQEESVTISGVFLYSALNPMANIKIALLDEDGVVLEYINTAEDGTFVFHNLDPDKNYAFKVAEEDVLLSDMARVYLTNSKGERVKELIAKDAKFFDFHSLPNEDFDGLSVIEVEDENLLTIFLYGQIYEFLPGDIAPGMEIQILNDEGEILYVARVGKEGKFQFENLPPDVHYIFRMKGEDSDVNFNLLDQAGEVLAKIEKHKDGTFHYTRLPSQNASMGTIDEGEDNVIPAFINLFGRVYKTLPGDVHPGMEVFLLNDEGEIVATAILQTDGSFSFKELPSDVNYTIRLAEEDSDLNLVFMDEHQKVLSTAKRLKDGTFKFKWLKPDKFQGIALLNEDDVLLKIASTESFIINDIYYDYNSWDINEAAAIELTKLSMILKKNPHIMVELGSYTDARGEDGFNMELSQRRANAAVGYLVKKHGIPWGQVKGIGHGETRLLNACTNGVECSDEEHSKNRRTEFSIKNRPL